MNHALINSLLSMRGSGSKTFDSSSPWEEGKHPREKNGEFAPKGGGSSGGSGVPPAPTTTDAPKPKISGYLLDEAEDLFFHMLGLKPDFGDGALVRKALDNAKKGETDDWTLDTLSSHLSPNHPLARSIAKVRAASRPRSPVDDFVPQEAAREIDRTVSAAREMGFKVTPQADFAMKGCGDGYNCFLCDAALFLRQVCHVVATPDGTNADYGGANHWLFNRLKNSMEKAHWVPVNASADEEVTRRTIGELPDGAWISFWTGGHNTSTYKCGGKWYKRDPYFAKNGSDKWEEVPEELVARKSAWAMSPDNKDIEWKCPCYAFVPGKSLIPDEFLKMMVNPSMVM